MLICQNCSTIQEDGVDRCTNCQMPGQLVPYHAAVRATPAKPFLAHLCQNCGGETPTDTGRCVHCRFPLARTQPTAKRDQPRNDQYQSRVG